MRFGREKRNLLILFSFLLMIGFFFSQNIIIESIEKKLSFHMIVEHSIFFMAGVSLVLINESIIKILNGSLLLLKKNEDQNHIKSNKFSYFFVVKELLKRWKSLLKVIFLLNKYPILWIFIAIDLMIFWHIPLLFDLAVLHNFTHILQHISFMIVGASIYMAIRNFGESFSLILLVFLIGMMGLSGILFSVVEDNIYVVYDIQNHHEAGFYMVVTSIVILILIFPIYLIKKAMFHIKLSNQKL